MSHFASVGIGLDQYSASIANGCLSSLVDSLIIVQCVVRSCLKAIPEALVPTVFVATQNAVYTCDGAIFW